MSTREYITSIQSMDSDFFNITEVWEKYTKPLAEAQMQL
jgi:hypothetical protein